MLLQVGRLCVKKYGRDAGDRAVITAVEKNGTVMIMTASRPKERKCNASHLEFLNEVVDIKNREHLLKTIGVKEKKVYPKEEAKQAKAERKKA
jgi:ribosomal protein L14E/L6E/L27E